MFTIRVNYRKQGNYFIMETTDVCPFKVSIITNIKPVKQQDGTLTISYEPYKAYMKANDKGYLTLYINE